MSKRFIHILLLSVGVFLSTWVTAAVKTYDLNIDEQIVNVTGKPLKRLTVNGKFVAPLLEFEEGDEAVIRVHNHLKNQDTSLHWHGLILPGIMDGVPGLNQFNGIAPHQTYEYKFKVVQNGTYWYHSHSKGQEQDGLYGPLVIYPKGKVPLANYEKTDRDYVVLLSDFHDSTSSQIMSNLKKEADYYQNERETVFDVLKQAKRDGVKATWKDRSMWNQMRMLKTDMSDVTGYTYLMNGRTPEQNWTGMFQSGEKIRLRFINASAMSFFDVRIPHLKMTVVSADGQPVKPVPVDEFRIGTAETYDVVVEPKQANYQIEAESIDRSGFSIGTLHQVNTPPVKQIEMPKSRPRALLTMQDMGMGHAGHDMSSMDIDMSDMDMDMGNMNQDMSSHAGHDMPAMKNDVVKNTADPVYGWANASTPMGDKALQYSDLKSLTPQKDIRSAQREIEVRLGGNMERYIWTMNGQKYSDSPQPLTVKYGERVRLKFVNESMMAHPMHLHGMFMQLENGQDPSSMPNKHTLIVPPGQTVTALLTADELGEWAIHCHLMYHMAAGMMNTLVVAHVDGGTHVITPAQKQGVNSHANH
ncbi:copper resistance system multicopper oxidase [Acinetobacter boissieri]|uniref:Copper-resistance protein, CopA family n=1 Tax=Acinetobacter boissieri TaxID=1219383 RepID=A0A1G6GH85_9GAMM|nr:copper resistance system multicopper oxidase [Acinetobacter boissieri]SDB81392.1 copper-resistance protein, CopA family [Acinetobacter boissieri]